MIQNVLVELFGEYTPLTETVLRTYSSAEGTTCTTEITQTISGIAGVDFQWVASVLLFAICLHGLFRILGVILK